MVFKKGHKHYPCIWTDEMRKKASKRVSGINNPMYGKTVKHKSETIEKMRLASLGKTHNKITKNKISQTLLKNHVMRGKTYEELYGVQKAKELRLVRSKRQKKAYNSGKRSKLYGELNNAWNGGSSFEPYSPKFNKQLKLEIKIRDDYMCQKCNIKIIKNTKNKFLTIHHIDYNKWNCNKNNLIVLCNSCNASVNGNRKYWTKYFQELKCMTMT